MSETAADTPTVNSLPRVGITVPGWSFSAAFCVVSAASCFALVSNVGWLIAGLVATALALLFPRAMLTWFIILFLGASLFWQQPDASNWRFYLLLACVHLLHVLGTLRSWVPRTARVQLVVLDALARRFLIIQLPVQVASVVVLMLWSGANAGHAVSAPAVGVVAGAALAALTVILMVPMFRRAHHK